MHAFTRIALCALVPVLVSCGGAEARKSRYIENGKAFMQAKEYEKARLEFRNALQIEPGSADLRYRVGEATEKMGSPIEAMQMYQAAIDADHANLKARARLGRLMVVSGATERGLSVIEPGLKLAPEDADLLAARAAARARNGDDAGAVTDAEHALHIDPANENAVASLCALYQKAGRVSEAIDIVRKALVSSPKSLDMHLILTQMLLSQGRRAEAEQELQRIVALEPGKLLYRTRLAELQSLMGNVKTAEQTLRQGVVLRPDDVDSHLALADFRAGHGDLPGALRELRASSDRDRGNLSFRLSVADFYATHDDGHGAEALYREISAADAKGPAGLGARNRIAAAYLRGGKAAEAQKVIDEVLVANPRDRDALMMRANLALSGGNVNAAVVDLRAVVRDQPNSLPARRLLARAYVQNNQTSLAEDTLREALTKNPSAMLAEMSAIFEQLGRHDEAIAYYESLYVKQPANDLVANNLAMLLVTHRSDSESAERAARLTQHFAESENPVLLDTYGWVQLERGDTPRALSALQRAVQLAPGVPALRYHLGMAQLKAGQSSAGRESLRLALSSGAPFEGYRDARETFDKMAAK